jgi:hypothetical protein
MSALASAPASAPASRVSASPRVVAKASSRTSAAAVRGWTPRVSRRPPRAGARPASTTRAASASGSGPGPASDASGDDEGAFREFPRDAEGNVVDLDGNPVLRPENNWVREMEREWAATGYDERFFDDDWDDVDPNAPSNKTPLTDAERFPFRDIQDHEWRETMTWEEEEADDAADPYYVESGPSAAPGPTPTPPPPSATPSESSRAGWTPPVQDLTQDEEAALMGFSPGSGADEEEEPEGPPAVLLAGFRAEECPRVRELLDELGGHDVPVVPVPQANLDRPLVAALSLPEPDWLSARTHDRFNQGGEFGSHRCVIFSGLDRGEMATVVSALEARGLPRLISVVITSDNADRTLGEALAEAVKEMRAERRRVDDIKSMDFAEEMRKLDAAAAKQGATAAELVEREIARQDALAADEAAALSARNERAGRYEARMAKLKEEYETRARARAAAESVSGRAPPADDDDEDPSRWPTLEDLESVASEYVDGGLEGFDLNLADVNLGDVARATGADGDALEAMVLDAVKQAANAESQSQFGSESASESSNAGGGPEVSDASGASNSRPIVPDEDALRASVAFEADDDADDSGVYEVDPTRWSERVDAARESPPPPPPPKPAATAERGPAPPPIEEPESAQANPASCRAKVRDAAVAGPPPERATETVEAQVMTKRMLRELAMRRGVSYTELLAQAEASGVELPEE